MEELAQVLQRGQRYFGHSDRVRRTNCRIDHPQGNPCNRSVSLMNSDVIRLITFDDVLRLFFRRISLIAFENDFRSDLLLHDARNAARFLLRESCPLDVRVVGGGGPTTPQARRPNSFIYRFIPYSPFDLKQGGKLQALQVMSLAHPGPIVFGSTATPADTDAAILSQDQKDLHTYGKVFHTSWVTIHDSATQSSHDLPADITC